MALFFEARFKGSIQRVGDLPTWHGRQGITLCEHSKSDKRYPGKVKHLRASVPNFNQIGFNDRVSHVIVHSGKWKFFEHAKTDARFPGRSWGPFGPGHYDCKKHFGNDVISSAQLVGDGPAWDDKEGITLAQHAPHDRRFPGVKIDLTESLDDLKKRGMDNTVSTVIIHSGKWALYEKRKDDPRFPGWKKVYGPGTYVCGKHFPNDQLSSVQNLEKDREPWKGPTEGVVLCQHGKGDKRFPGKTLAMTKSVPNLKQLGFNDQISHIEVKSGKWRFFEHSKSDKRFPGKIWGPFGKGEYGTKHFGNDKISSFQKVGDGKPWDDRASGVSLCQHGLNDKRFPGKKVWRDKSVENFKRIGMNDKVSAIIVHGGKWKFFKHALNDKRFPGKSWGPFGKGEYGTQHFGNDQISAMQMVGDGKPWDQKEGITLCEHGKADKRYPGKTIDLKDSVPSLKKRGFNDKVSHIIIHNGQWKFFEHAKDDPRFPGKVWGPFKPGEYLARKHFGNDKISSFQRVGDGAPWDEKEGVTLCKHAPGHPQFDKKKLDLTESLPDLKTKGIDDVVSMITVHSGKWAFYQHAKTDPRFPGWKKVYGPGVYHAKKHFPNDQLSAVQNLKQDPKPWTGETEGVILAQHAKKDRRFPGRVVHSKESVEDLRRLKFNDKVSHITVKGGEWRFFQHTKGDRRFPGKVWGPFGPGEYGLKHFKNDQISSFQKVGDGKPWDQRDNGVTLNEHGKGDKRFPGKTMVLENSLPNFNKIGLNDKVSHIEVHGGEWKFFQHARGDKRFPGKTYGPFGPGEYSAQEGDFKNDAISAAQKVGDGKPWDQKEGVSVSKHAKGKGKTKDFKKSCPNFKKIGMNDKVSSIVVHSGEWKFFEHAKQDARFPGKVWGPFKPGSYNAKEHFGNDAISSAQLVGDGPAWDDKEGVTLCKHSKKDKRFPGRKLDLKASVEDLKKKGFNDKCSTIVVHSGKWAFYQHSRKDPRFPGWKKEFGPGVYEAKKDFPNDELSAVQNLTVDKEPWQAEKGAVQLYEHGKNDKRFPGRTVVTDVSIPHLGRKNFNNKCSLIIINEGEWYFYKRPKKHLRFPEQTWGPFGPGEYDTAKFGNDAISSLQRKGDGELWAKKDKGVTFQPKEEGGKPIYIPQSSPDIPGTPGAAFEIHQGEWKLFEFKKTDPRFPGKVLGPLGPGKHEDEGFATFGSAQLVGDGKPWDEKKGLTLCEQPIGSPEFPGATKDLERSEQDFAKIGMDDKVSSIVIHSGQWTFFEFAKTDPRFPGKSWGPFGPGRYHNKKHFGDDKISSAQAVGDGEPWDNKKGATVTQHDPGDPNFPGVSVTTEESIPWLQKRGMQDNGTVTVHTGKWMLYEHCKQHPHFPGKAVEAKPGVYVADKEIPRNIGAIQNLKADKKPWEPAPEGGLFLCDQPAGRFYPGETLHVATSVEDLGEFANKTSHIVIKEGEWRFYTKKKGDADFPGKVYGPWGPGEYDVQEKDFEGDAIASLQMVGDGEPWDVRKEGLTLYERPKDHPDGPGKSVWVKDNVEDLATIGMLNAVGHITVHGGKWRFYHLPKAHAGFPGGSYGPWGPGEYPCTEGEVPEAAGDAAAKDEPAAAAKDEPAAAVKDEPAEAAKEEPAAEGTAEAEAAEGEAQPAEGEAKAGAEGAS